MCGIAGYCDFNDNLEKHREGNASIVEKMGRQLIHRGPDAFGVYVGEHVAFAHARLSVIDIEGGIQPMTREYGGWKYTVVYNGELYNTQELRKDLQQKGYEFDTTSDTEVLLKTYMEYGKEMVHLLNGIYGFAIWDEKDKSLFLCRDRYGVKPLFYAERKGQFIFASEIKGILAHPLVEPVINEYGLCELFGIGPARSPGCGVYEGIHEIPPGYIGYVDYSGCKISRYWEMEAKVHTESYEETVEHARELLFDAIRRQLVSDVPICTLLSGGLDSSLISAVSADYLKKQGKQLDTYSFDYVDNHLNFKSSSFQPDEDRPFVDVMIHHIGSKHRFLECYYEELYYCLFDAVHAKDLPGMADVDSSMLYFAKKIKKNHTVCLSGECADEIFGGYPWFRDEEVYTKACFPWSKNPDIRKMVLNDSVLKKLPMDDYVRCQYEKTMRRVPLHGNETALEKRQKEISYLNTSWFMTTLLDRKDRMTMAASLEVRVPFADHRLISYLYNVPWDYKYHNGEVKGLLKDVGKDMLPDEVLYRKKCPYPKTYDPKYEQLLKTKLKKILQDEKEPLHYLANKTVLADMIEKPSDYGKPWFGQLMALPQMYAYMIEVNYWLKKYKVRIKI